MERTGARARHRAPVRYEPGNTYFWGSMLLTAAFGMSCVGVSEAHSDGHARWAGFFTVMAVVAAGLYFWSVKSWLTWVSPTGD